MEVMVLTRSDGVCGDGGVMMLTRSPSVDDD